MADATISYGSKEAGQQVSGTTYLNHMDDTTAQAALDAALPFLIPNCWRAINVIDGTIDGDGSAVTDTKEVWATFLCEDNTTSSVRLPFVDITKGMEDFTAAFGLPPGGGLSDLTNENGSKLKTLVKYQEVNFK